MAHFHLIINNYSLTNQIKLNKLTKNIYHITCNEVIFYKCRIDNSSHFRQITMKRLPQALAKCCRRASVACLNRFVFGPGRRVPNSYSSCSSSWSQIFKGPKNPKAFLICSGVQRQFAYTFMLTLPIDLPSQIFHLFSN